MDNRKRARLLESLDSAMPLAGQSIYLTSSGAGATLAATDLLFTICDEPALDSDDSQQYLIDSEELVAHIKQEQQETIIQNPQQQQQLLPLQYRIVNQLQRQFQAEVTQPTLPLSNATALLPTAVQLPSGCEIFLVKEFVEPAPRVSMELIGSSAMPGCSNDNNNTTTITRTIKYEPGTKVIGGSNNLSLPGETLSATEAAKDLHIVRQRAAPNVVVTAPITSVAAATAAGTATGIGGKRGYILETYKKRDDKRRATHNEVERRRRDKINSWIFKLKEMLPGELPNQSAGDVSHTNIAAASGVRNVKLSSSSHNNNTSANIASSVAACSQQRQPASDSKSQILIKACEYICAMQDEMQSLRECLAENENLRVCNQRLEIELQKLKIAYAKLSQTVHHRNSDNINTADNSSTSSNDQKFQLTLNSDLFAHSSDLEIMPVVGEFDSALLLAGNSSASCSSSTSSATSPLDTATYASGGANNIKHELILNDLHV